MGCRCATCGKSFDDEDLLQMLQRLAEHIELHRKNEEKQQGEGALDNRPQVVLLSRLSIGETLHKALQNVCTVKWIARKSEFRTDPVRFPLHLLREFFRLLAPCLSLRQFPKAKRPIVIVHSIGLDAIPAFIVRRVTGCKVMLYAVGPDVLAERKPAQTSFLRWAVRAADVVLCGNSRIEEEVRNLGGTATRVLPTPFVPSEPGINRNKEFDVVTVGSLTDAAKQSLLVEASAYLDPSVKIAIVGEGPQRHYLTKLSRRHGRNQVSFLGDLPPRRLYHTLCSSTLYVQCSPDEGTRSSVLEAASCGLPIIALNGDKDPELTELYGLRPIVPEDRYAISLANAIEGAMENYSALLADVSRNREALESYSRSWPSMAATAIFS
jgi:glycosyltransferase involved in cell wall biosynthesis